MAFDRHSFIITPAARVQPGSIFVEELRLVETTHAYEMIVILSPDLADDDLTAGIDRVHQAISSRGGEILDVNNWGRRRLAYPIKRHLEGTYFITQMKMDPGQIVDLESNLRISEDVLRHLIVRTDE
jgi:small subunit ribosomal protein S6